MRAIKRSKYSKKNKGWLCDECYVPPVVEDEKKWWTSTNEEFFGNGPFATMEEAIEDGKVEYHENGQFYVGWAERHTVLFGDLADVVIDDIRNNMEDEYGEYADDYLCSTPEGSETELHNALQEVVEAWIVKHDLLPNSFWVRDIETILCGPTYDD
ncbi:MAG: hypothetical protein ACQ5SW_08290 [Sphaerochaetaceae bacterium]